MIYWFLYKDHVLKYGGILSVAWPEEGRLSGEQERELYAQAGRALNEPTATVWALSGRNNRSAYKYIRYGCEYMTAGVRMHDAILYVAPEGTTALNIPAMLKEIKKQLF